MGVLSDLFSNLFSQSNEPEKEEKENKTKNKTDKKRKSDKKKKVDKTEVTEPAEEAAEKITVEEKPEKKEKKNKKDKKGKKGKKDKKDKKKKEKTPLAEIPEVAPIYYTNRELSWMQFNERVLEEAGNVNVPLAERLTYISIYQSNLDEFYMVRVGTLMDAMQEDDARRESKTLMTPSEQISAILKRTKELEKKKADIYDELMASIEQQGVRLINFSRLSKAETDFLEKYFNNYIAPYLSPMTIARNQPFPFMSNKDIFAVLMMNDKAQNQTIGLVSCTNEVFKRVIDIPSRPGYFMLSEDLILHFAPKLFANFTVRDTTLMRITRNADINTSEAYDEELNVRDVMSDLVKRRRRMSPVRIEVSKNLDSKTKAFISKSLNLSSKHIIKVDTPLDMKFTGQLQKAMSEKTELFYEKRIPRYTNQLERTKPFIPQIADHDVILAYPFYTFRYFIRLLKEAANDDSVLSIKMTLYRVADQSKIVDTLIEAAENGKEVDVLVELRARFDEESNIDASKRLEEAGCNVIYGLEEYKVHSKLLVITRKTDAGIGYITQIGTGNFNEKTANLYTDLALLTADERIGAESTKTFNSMLIGEVVDETEHLLVAPKCLQNKLCDMIDDEIAKAKAGQLAYIGIKINSLTDKVIIDKLIEASQSGVKIDLVIRGICCLKPGIEGFTDNIRVISIVGRFLEHSRIYIFGAGDDAKMYISSADFMTRNTIRRVEIAAPLYDAAVRMRVRSMFSTILRDDEKGKEQHADGLYYPREINDVKVNSQELFYDEAYAEEERTKEIPSAHHNEQ